jgi:hypothetical protein
LKPESEESIGSSAQVKMNLKTIERTMKHATKYFSIITLSTALIGLAASVATPARAVDLLQRYPTTLTSGVTQPDQARPWQFTPSDVFRVSRFHLEVGDKLKVDTGAADLGIGHGADGAVCAIFIPAEGGTVTRAGQAGEAIAHIWLRFHPGEINRLFPPDTVSAATTTSVITQMRTIAGAKFRSSWHAGMNAMIPDPKDMTVDLDTKAGVRRFFMVDTQARTAEYAAAFERQAVRQGARGPTGPAPKLIATKPANGATDVDPGVTEITVTFDQDMGQGCSWVGGGPEYPGSPDGEPEWRGKRTCVLPVKLEAGHHYEVGINSPTYRNFRSAAGQPAAPSTLSFTTK